MVRICPCMADAFPLAKKRLTSATSSGSIHRLIGVSLATQSASPPGSKSAAVIAVLTAPGAVKTGMTAADFEPGGLADWVASETPIKRWIEPEEVAEVSLFLASGKAIAMQGQILTIDGGWSLK